MKKHLRRLLIAVLSLTVMLAMSAAVFADENEPTVSDGLYDVTVTSTLSMFKIQNAQIDVTGEDATLIINSTNADRYGEIYLGQYEDINEENKDTIGVKGNIVDAENNVVQFAIPIKTADLLAWLDSDDQQSPYVLRYVDPYTSKPENSGIWYKGSKPPYYLKLSDLTLKEVPLAITNNTSMFKAVSASLKTEGENTSLVVALNSAGYHYLYKGTYEEAVANGENRENWIAGYENSEGKWEFVLPLENNDSYVPVVAISQSYLDKHDKGENSLERAFYPRQFTIDREAKTLVTGDYENTKELTVTNNISMFKTPAAKIDTVGGPNSNNYKSDLVLTMQNDSVNELFVGTHKEASAADNTIKLDSDNVFTLPVRWVETFGQPETMKTLFEKPFKASFRSKKNGNWYEREITIDEKAGTIVFNNVVADYNAVDAAIAGVPADLSIYTDETAKAVNDAVEAVKRDKNVSEQDAVDAMAAAINDAVEALQKKSDQPQQPDQPEPVDFSDVTINAIPAKTYTGKALTPKVTVKYGETELVKDQDYTVAYKNNKNAGKATVTLTGKGNYKGAKTVSFTIKPAAQKLTVSKAAKSVKVKTLKKKAAFTSKVVVRGAKTKVTYTKVAKGSSKKLTINKKTGKIKVAKKTKKGTYKIKVKVTAAKSKNYKAASITKVIKVVVK